MGLYEVLAYLRARFPKLVIENCSGGGNRMDFGIIRYAHTTWTSYSSGERWNIIFDVSPAKGQRFLMDGAPGLIHSADDFGINAAGLMVTETTITLFQGFDPKGKPEFVRARKALPANPA